VKMCVDKNFCYMNIQGTQTKSCKVGSLCTAKHYLFSRVVVEFLCRGRLVVDHVLRYFC